MKNMKIERILKAWEERQEPEVNDAVCAWCRYYTHSKEKGLDEIVIEAQECVHGSDVKELIEAAKELKIEYFVYASTFSGAFNVVNLMVENGARVGKFVVKEYTEHKYGEDVTTQIPGLRINL